MTRDLRSYNNNNHSSDTGTNRMNNRRLLLLCWLLRTFSRSFSQSSLERRKLIANSVCFKENPLRLFTTRLFGANWLTAPGPTNTDMVSGYRVQLLASGAAMNAYQAPRASTAGAASQANAPRRGRSQPSTLQVEPAAAKNRASDAKM